MRTRAHQMVFSMFVSVAVLLAICGTAFASATIQGAVTEAGGGPLSGVAVSFGAAGTVTTGADGSYSLIVAPGTHTITAYDDNHYPKTYRDVALADGDTAIKNFSLVAVPAPSDNVSDTFTRAANCADLGITEDSNGYHYDMTSGLNASEGQAACIQLDELYQLSPGSSGDSIVAIVPNDSGKQFLPADFDLTVKMFCPSGSIIGWCYRQSQVANPGYGNGGYGLFIHPDGQIRIFGHGDNWWQTHQVFTYWDAPHIIRLRVVGNHHQVWVDGDKIIDMLDVSQAANNAPGYIYTYVEDGTEATIDDLNIDVFTAPTATVNGTVSDQDNPALKIEGANVTVDGYSTTTNASGAYTVVVPANAIYRVTAAAERYYDGAVDNVQPVPGETTTVDIALKSQPYGDSPDVVDTFTRADGMDLGVTEDASHFTWVKTNADANITGGIVIMPTGGNVAIGATAGGVLFQPTDFDLTLKVKNAGNGNWGIGWRQGAYAEPGYANGGYMLLGFASGGTSVYSSWSGHRWGGGYSVDPNTFHTVRVKVVGDHHKVWIDNNIVNDFVDTNPARATGAGYIYVTSSDPDGQEIQFDDVQCYDLTTFSGVLNGTITDSQTSAPVSGATVRLSTGTTATSDPNGRYEFTRLPTVTCSITVSHDSYYQLTVPGISVTDGATTTQDVAVVPIASTPTFQAYDTFGRADNLSLGVTEDVNHWTWFKSKDDVQILSNQLVLPTGGCAGPDKTSDGTLFRPADFELEATFVNTAPGGYLAVGYRNSSYAGAPYANGGYSMWVNGSSAYLYSTWLGPVGGSTITPTPDLSVPHTVKIRAFANHHQMWFDGQKVVDYYDTSAGTNNAGGYIYLTDGVASNATTWDNLDCKIWIPPTATISGTVTDSTNSSKKIAGATVTVGGQSVTTDVNGLYLVSVPAVGNSFMVSAWADDYFPSTPVSVTPVQGNDPTVNIALSPIPRATAADVLDTYSRPDSTELGVTEDSNHWSYFRSQSSLQILGGVLDMPVGGNVGPDQKADGVLFRPADFDSTVTVLNTSSTNIGFCYRQNGYADPGYANGGYMAFVFADGSVSLYSSWNGHQWQSPISPAPDWNVPHILKVRAFGNHHQAWLDEQKIIEVFDNSASAKNVGGYLYMTPSSEGPALKWDDLKIASGALLPSAVPVTSAAQAKAQLDGTEVVLSGVEVTRAFDGFFYVGDADRSAGLRVDSSTMVLRGDRVQITGTMATEGNERKLVADSVNPTNGLPTIMPLGIRNTDVGLSTVGLLAVVWGSVTQTPGQDWGYVPITDGSGGELKIKLEFDYSTYTYPVQGDYITAIGVHGSTAGSVIHVKEAGDIRKMAP